MNNDQAYYSAFLARAIRALKVANRSGNAKRKSAAFKAVNHFRAQLKKAVK